MAEKTIVFTFVLEDDEGYALAYYSLLNDISLGICFVVLSTL